MEQAAAGIGLHVNALKTENMCYNQTGDITTLDGNPLKLVDKFTYLGSSISSTEKDINTRLTKAWTAIDRLSIIWKSNLTDKMKRSFFQAAVVSILLYGCTTWTLTKRLEKKLDDNYTRMLRSILNKSWQQHPTRHQLYGHLPSITKTIQARQTRHEQEKLITMHKVLHLRDTIYRLYVSRKEGGRGLASNEDSVDTTQLLRNNTNNTRINRTTIVWKQKVATLIKGDQKAPFSIATTTKCWGGRYSFPWIASL